MCIFAVHIVPAVVPEPRHSDQSIAMIDGKCLDSALAGSECRQDAERAEIEENDFAAPVAVRINKDPCCAISSDGSELAIRRCD